MSATFPRVLHRLALAFGAALAFTWLAAVPSARAEPTGSEPFEHYGKAQGLTNLNMTCLVQDRPGFLWACTQNGLFRFDGARFERWGEARGVGDDTVYWAALGPEGRLWAATATDLLRQRDDGRFEPVLESPLAQADPGRTLVFFDTQRAAVAARGRLHRLERADAAAAWTQRPFFDARQLAAEPALQSVHALALAPDGALWMGCGDRLCEWREGRLRVWSREQGVPAADWRELLFDRDGTLWARSSDALVVRAPRALAFEARTPPRARLVEARVSMPMAQDAQGRMLARVDGGVARWVGGRWELLDDTFDQHGELVAAILVDRDGALWLGRQSHGVDRWRGYAQWDNYARAHGLDSAIWAMARDAGGDLIAGTGKGCRRLAAGARRLSDCGFVGLPAQETIYVQRGSDGSLYLGPNTSDTGITIYRVPPGRRVAEPIARAERVYAMRMDARDRLWLASHDGPAVIDLAQPSQAAGPARVRRLRRAEPMRANDVAIGPDGSVWFVGDNHLMRVRGEDDAMRHTIDDARLANGMNNIAVSPQGDVWVAAGGRVASVRFDGGRVAGLDWADTPLLRDARVVLLRVDPQGRVWVGTDLGLLVRDGSGWRRVDQSDGLVWDDVNSESFLADADGSLWFGTSAGLSHLLDPRELRRPQRLELVLSEVAYGTQALHAGQGDEVTRLPWAPDAALRVRLAALSPALADGARFRYRIVGLSDEWFETPIAEVRIPSLHPGDYRLEAQAVHEGRALTSEVVLLPFVVSPPWWRTLVFQALLAAALAAAVVLAWRWRSRILKRRQRELETLLERATRDPLTGLWNRATILDLLHRELARARLVGAPLAVAVLDIDHFKRVNDTHGHLGGDEVLRTLGRELARSARQTDLLGRYGGEELLLVMPGLPHEVPSGPVERLRQRVAESVCRYDGRVIRVTASMGVGWWRPIMESAEALIADADAALYAAKAAGRDRVVYAGHADPAPETEPEPEPEPA